MKWTLAAALILNTMSASAAGTLSSLVSFEQVFSRPSTATSNTQSIMSASVEYVFPRSLSVYGGVAFILRDSFESTINLGTRLYSFNPVFHVSSKPVWSYIGIGTYLVDNNAYYPEVGLRFATTPSSRMDVFLKVLNSSDTAYDKHASIGVGFTF